MFWEKRIYGYNPPRIHIEAIITFDLVDLVEIMLALRTIYLLHRRAEGSGNVEQSEPQQDDHKVNLFKQATRISRQAALEPKFFPSPYKLVQTRESWNFPRVDWWVT